MNNDVDLQTSALAKVHEYAQKMREAGQLPSQEKLNQYYAVFQDKFGPTRLATLDGRELLERMHAHGTDESLVYWLEFKRDEEFPAIFGSIAGGSALKFGLYRNKDSGQWMTGTARNQLSITEPEAISLARRHRDQLIAATKVLDEYTLPAGPLDVVDEAYQRLQDRIMQAAPDVANFAWGHKYFSLYAPDKLDDYHSEEFQRFHLIKMLQLPPDPGGRYAYAGRFVKLAEAAALPMNHLTTVLNRLNGSPYKYWRIGTNVGGTDVWPGMRAGGFAAIGWSELGDLSDLEHNAASKEQLAERLRASGKERAVATRQAGEILDFIAKMQDGDVAVAANGQQILGIGKVSGEYEYRPDRIPNAPHQRTVRWSDVAQWKLAEAEGLQTTVREFRKLHNKLAFEARLQEAPVLTTQTQTHQASPSSKPLEPIIQEIDGMLRRKGQAILYGPPGTGKTYWARRAALELAARATFGEAESALDSNQQEAVQGKDGLVQMVTFHPGFGYEDFIEGYRPESADGQLSFQLRDGIFKSLCDKARADGRPHFLIVDEINRGDIPRIFGELITLLEADKRDLELALPSGRTLSVPKNLHIIGTMNTADRSVALLDVALRRRFGFLELLPETEHLQGVVIGDRLPLARWLDALNEKIRSSLGRDARSLQIGHAFFLEHGKPITNPQKFAAVVAGEIAPLLQEYCYEDYSALHHLVGGLVDTMQQRIRTEFFASANTSDLLTALLEPFPDLTTSGEAIASDVKAADSQEQDEPDE